MRLLLVLLLTLPALARPVHRLELPELKDPARDQRLVQTRITYPEGDGPFPVVLVSHGNGGNWSSHQQLVDSIAAHGYVVMAPNHPASDTNRVFRQRKTYATGPDPGRDPAAVFGRPKDLSFLIDRAQEWNAQTGHPLYRQLDLDHIAAVGHSYGSYTVQAVCGAVPILDNLKPAVPPGRGPAPSFRDPRVDVGVVYSPSGPGSYFFDEGSYAGLMGPMLCLTGERDTQLSGGLKSAQDRYRAYQLMPPGDKYHLWLANAGHNGWDDLGEASRWARNAWRKATPEAPDVVRISTAVTLAFLDLYLKGDQAARQRLTQAYVDGLTGKVVTRVRLEAK